ncbi:MAG: ArsR/SmtB family transcription factor [Hyphomicrobiales bacterium]
MIEGLNIEKLQLAAERLRAMAHPMRIAILELLSKADELNVTDIYTSLSIEQATASHHLNVLRNKGILESRRDGKKIYYSLSTKSLSEVLSCINKCGK